MAPIETPADSQTPPGSPTPAAEVRAVPESNLEVQRQKSLIKKGALQDAIFNSAHFSSIATDERGVIQIFNVGAERMLGYAADEVVNRITPADISDPQEVIARAESLSLELGTPITPGFEALVFKASRGIEDIYELTYIRRNGSRIAAVVSVTALRDDHEAIIGYLLIGTDNTARKLAENALREAGALQNAIFNSANFSSIATDDKGVIQIFNVGAERMLGYEAADVVNCITPAAISDPQELVARASLLSVELDTPITPGFEALVFKASRGIEDIYELTYIRKDGSRFPAMVSVTALRDARGVILGYLLIGTDNTARKQVETERKGLEVALQEKNIELEHASRMKSEFLATMSHELRTPLNAIIGFSEALKDGLMGPVTTTQHEYINDIFTSGQHLLSLINDILDLSKVEAGMMALELEAFELYPVLANSLTIVREKAAGQRISLVLEADRNLGIAQLDLRKTKQIIYNLLANAVKFSATGGRVTLRAQRVPRAAVGKLPGKRPAHGFPLAESAFSGFLEICVTDSGIGISEPDMAKLFQAFTQIDSSLARRFEGSGLGLAMVKQLAELLGGTVAVASLEGQGASFAVWLPMRESGATSFSAGTIPALGNPATGVAKERIALVVEDDPKAADLLRLLLEADGFRVLIAASGEAALEMAPRQPLAIITLDIQLPGMDGWEFLMHIREMDSLARVPVVVVSSLAENHMALADGASAVLQKPVNRAQLKDSLARLGLLPDTGRTHSILVVDDDPMAIEVIAAFLPSPSYSVARAHSGTEAIEMAQQLRPDLILLDLMMPGVSGFEVAMKLRSAPATATTPILVITAKTITDADRLALHIVPGGVINIVSKAGFDRGSFIDEVRRILPLRPGSH